jgi:hypothetical protein
LGTANGMMGDALKKHGVSRLASVDIFPEAIDPAIRDRQERITRTSSRISRNQQIKNATKSRHGSVIAWSRQPARDLAISHRRYLSKHAAS